MLPCVDTSPEEGPPHGKSKGPGEGDAAQDQHRDTGRAPASGEVRALEERTDVSALLCRLAEQYLKAKKGSWR
jgi:hypothetical protein